MDGLRRRNSSLLDGRPTPPSLVLVLRGREIRAERLIVIPAAVSGALIGAEVLDGLSDLMFLLVLGAIWVFGLIPWFLGTRHQQRTEQGRPAG
ncbi:hypothetical protein B7486_72275 [cyanobacterium TDX16]|nr:hypothetical protein B7486_72275 [cyanobacterium TDX16]